MKPCLDFFRVESCGKSQRNRAENPSASVWIFVSAYIGKLRNSSEKCKLSVSNMIYLRFCSNVKLDGCYQIHYLHSQHIHCARYCKQQRRHPEHSLHSCFYKKHHVIMILQSLNWPLLQVIPAVLQYNYRLPINETNYQPTTDKASTSQHLTIKYTHIRTINPILHTQSYVLCMQTGQQVSGRDIALWPGPQGTQVVICKITICKDNV